MLHAAAAGGQPFRRYLLLDFPRAIFVFLAGETLVPMDEAAKLNMGGTLLSNWYLIAICAIVFGCSYP